MTIRLTLSAILALAPAFAGVASAQAGPDVTFDRLTDGVMLNRFRARAGSWKLGFQSTSVL